MFFLMSEMLEQGWSKVEWENVRTSEQSWSKVGRKTVCDTQALRYFIYIMFFLLCISVELIRLNIKVVIYVDQWNFSLLVSKFL